MDMMAHKGQKGYYTINHAQVSAFIQSQHTDCLRPTGYKAVNDDPNTLPYEQEMEDHNSLHHWKAAAAAKEIEAL